MKTLQQQTKHIMLDLNRFADPSTYTVEDGKLVRQAPKEQPRPQYALDNERAKELSRAAAAGEAKRLRDERPAPDEVHDGD